MDQIQTLTEEIGKVLSGNNTYNTYRPIWRYLLESYVGGEEYRRAQHLVRYQLESDGEYGARLKTTPLQNHCQSVVSVYTSFLFRQEPEREFGALEMAPELDDFLNDADFEGRSFTSFMKEASAWSSVFGHAWVVMAKANINAANRAEELAEGIRPYVALLTPMVVLDWRYARRANGAYELSYFKYIEDVNGDVTVVKEWDKEIVRTRVINTKDKMINEDVVEVNELGRIPAVCVYNKRGVQRGLGVSDIADIADAQRFIYNATSEIDQSIRLDSHPSLVKTPDTQAGVGAGAIIHMPENLDSGLKPYILEFTGANVQNILQVINSTVESIDKMANTGAVRATESRILSGVAMQTEFQLLNARISEKAAAMELAEEQLWELFCVYQGYEWKGEIEYQRDYNLKDDHAEIQKLVQAKSAATDPRVLRYIDHEIIEVLGENADLILPETVQLQSGQTVPYDSAEPFDEPEELYNPETGESGWVIDFQSKREAMLAGWIEKD